ncbi:MAG: hypothetical protein AVDCRST_MAG61-606, partial [uncultured Friedmanniella sp.]
TSPATRSTSRSCGRTSSPRARTTPSSTTRAGPSTPTPTARCTTSTRA